MMVQKNSSVRGASRAVAVSGDSLVDSFLDWIEQYIEDNNVQVGDPLPTEEEIVKQTQLSRTSVREGLPRLRALGVVETKRKRGMRLTRSAALLDLVRLLSQSEIPREMMSHVKSFRSAVELGLGPEIFKQCRPSHIKTLRQIYDRMVEEADNPEVWPELDRDFHMTLVSISGNRLADWFHQLLDPFFQAFAPAEYPVSDDILDRHMQIIVPLKEEIPSNSSTLSENTTYENCRSNTKTTTNTL